MRRVAVVAGIILIGTSLGMVAAQSKRRIGFRGLLRRVCDYITRPERCPVTGKVHDYPMSIQGEPWHMVALTCKHCNEQFYI